MRMICIIKKNKDIESFCIIIKIGFKSPNNFILLDQLGKICVFETKDQAFNHASELGFHDEEIRIV